ncbi:MAG TPA: cupin domain-containing protein [bacterium]|nr:cupin domain-containing protein [bacterium]
MQAFEISELLRAVDRTGHVYAEFLRVKELSVGLARWPAGSVDDQTPHSEDEVYYVVAGQAVMRVEDEERSVAPGSIVYVPAGVEHRFVRVAEDLEVLVFWAPPRTSRRPRDA